MRKYEWNTEWSSKVEVTYFPFLPNTPYHNPQKTVGKFMDKETFRFDPGGSIRYMLWLWFICKNNRDITLTAYHRSWRSFLNVGIKLFILNKLQCSQVHSEIKPEQLYSWLWKQLKCLALGSDLFIPGIQSKANFISIKINTPQHGGLSFFLLFTQF